MRERSSQRRVVTGQDRQSVLQLLNLRLDDDGEVGGGLQPAGVVL